MPFDVLPTHHITLPKVDFYHPPWQLAQMALEAMKYRGQMLMNGVDKVLQAADPLNIAQRAVAMANAAYEKNWGIPGKIQQAQFQQQYGLDLQRLQAEAQKAGLNYQIDRFNRAKNLAAAAQAASQPGNTPASPGTTVPYAATQNAFTQGSPTLAKAVNITAPGQMGTTADFSVVPQQPAPLSPLEPDQSVTDEAVTNQTAPQTTTANYVPPAASPSPSPSATPATTAWIQGSDAQGKPYWYTNEGQYSDTNPNPI